jgi:nicotinamide-nucleotide amidase
MQAEVISIGDELTSGQRLDTNSQWLSQRLGELGVQVLYHTTVADDLEANVRVFREASERVDLVVATGGLGPTADDLTRDALARLAAVDLVLDPDSLAHIRGLFAHRKREMPERNVVQAMFPAGSRPIFNPQGTAPGIELSVPRPGGRRCHLFALPGVPAEMQEMWQQSVAPAIARMGDAASVIRHRRIKCFGVGESDLEQMLPDLIRRGRVPQVGITVSGATITLRITASGATPQECLALMEPTVATIHQCLGPLVFGEEDEELEHVIVRLLAARGATLSTAEWGTAGLIADWLGDLRESRECYLGGLILSSRQAAENLLDLPTGTIVDEANPEAALVEIMADGCRRRLGADYGLAVGPFPSFDPQSQEPGGVFFAVASQTGVVVRSSTFAGHPSILRTRAAKQALDLLRLTLLGSATDG